jgi:hypothetical protein
MGVGRGPPERDQGAVRSISEAEAADESGCLCQELKELGGLEPERGGPLLIDEGPLQDEQRTRRFRSEVALGSLLRGEYGRDDAYAFDGSDFGDNLCPAASL